MSKKILSEAKCRFKGNKNDKNDYVFILEEPRNSIYKYTILSLDKDKFINCIKEKANLYENNTSEGVTIPDYLVELRTTYHDTQKQSVKDLNLSSGIITVTDKGISIDPKYFSEHDDDSKKEFFK